MTRSVSIKVICTCAISYLMLTSCNNHRDPRVIEYQPIFQVDSSTEKTLVFGFPSFIYAETAQPLIKYLNSNLQGSSVKVKACVTVESYLDDLRNKRFDITVANGIIALGDHGKGYTIVGKINEDEKYTGTIFTRKDADIRNVTDLKGKKISTVRFTWLPGSMMPLYFMHEKGLDVNKDIQRVEVSSFESAIINTYLGKSEAGISLTRNWKVYTKHHPEILLKVEAKWETPPLTNNALLIKSNKDPVLANDLLNVLLNVHQSAEGLRALQPLGITGFEKADKHTYKDLMDFKKKYDSVIF